MLNKIGRKCAIYNRYSIDNQERLEKNRNILIDYCAKTLKVEDYVIFEEIGSVLQEREKFDELLKRIHNQEFTDLVVINTDRLYKPAYNKKKYKEILLDILKYDVKIHEVKLNKIISKDDPEIIISLFYEEDIGENDDSEEFE